MNTRWLSVLLAGVLAGVLATPVLAQSRRDRSEPPARFDNFDDDEPNFRHHQPYPYPRGQDSRRDDEDNGAFLWLFIILALGLVGGGGYYWWDHWDGDGGSFE